ncbi:MAG: hypothetical protein IPJ79_08845 [Bacteroidetes bacterium]|nr:hypothetical protein [Bacteroidota bacterium]
MFEDVSFDNGIQFSNYGAVNVDFYELGINNSSGIHSGTYNIDGGELSGTAQLSFTGPTFNVTGNVTLTSLKFEGSTNQTLTGGGTIQNMHMQNASGITLGSDITVTNNITFSNGVIDAGTYTLICGPSISIANGPSSWVNGKMQHTYTADETKIFQVGDASNFAGVTLHTNSLTSSGDITVNTLPGDHPNIATSGIDNNQSVNRNWHIENNGTVFADCWALFDWQAGDVDGGADFNNFIIAKYDDPTWTTLTTGPPNATFITAFGITSFSDFQIGEPVSVAPVPYRTVASGNWNTTSNWEIFDGSSWIVASTPPNAANSDGITVRTGHNMFAGSSINIDQTIIEAGASLGTSESTIDVEAGAGTDLEVNGDLYINTGSLAIASGALVTIANGGALESDFANFYGPGTLGLETGSTWSENSNSSDFDISDDLVINNQGSISINTTGIFNINDNSVINNYGSLTFGSSTTVATDLAGKITNNAIGTITKEDASTTTINDLVVWKTMVTLL